MAYATQLHRLPRVKSVLDLHILEYKNSSRDSPFRRLEKKQSTLRAKALPANLGSSASFELFVDHYFRSLQTRLEEIKEVVESRLNPSLIADSIPDDVIASSQAAIDRLKALLEPTPGAAEKLGPSWGTKLFQKFFDAILNPFQDGHFTTTKLVDAIHSTQETFKTIFPDAFSSDLDQSISEMWVAIESFKAALTASIPQEGNAVTISTGLVGAWFALLLLWLVTRRSDGTDIDLGSEYEVPKKYSPDAVAKYFERRQWAVWTRCLTVLSSFGAFYINIQTDKLQNKLKENEGKRAVQLRNIIEKLGPTYIKVAQSLSTRVDILSEKYFAEIERLQDRVPPFSSKVAYELIEAELGQKIGDVFESLTESTVASASLGQVYRGKLRKEFGGGDVAVKVQRPNVLSQVALDLYVARLLAIYVMPRIQRTKTDYLGLVDEYANRFFQEMDYEQEVKNGILFREQMASLDGVVVPKYYSNLTTRKILVSEWITGEKLIESSAPDVRELCNTLLNVYLVQLLDTGFLHADPHPGNLIRTPDGKICIIDFGLMTNITKEQRDNLVEYIANLTTENWTGVAYSLQALGFIPPNSPDPVQMGLVEPLEIIFSQIVQGGGADALKKRFEEIPRLDQVRQQLDDLSNDFPFSVPTFFTLILRSFSVIEGIALGVDPTYSITMECFPYIARRILTDNDPRMNKILRGVLFGNKNRLDIGRIERVTKGLREFTVAGLPGEAAAMEVKSSPAINSTIREALEVLFSPKGSYIQDLLVEEMVSATDAMSREALSRLVGAYMESLPAMVSLRTLEILGPLRTVVVPFLTPPEIVERLRPAISVTKEDEEALSTIRGIIRLAMEVDLASSGSRSNSIRSTMSRTATELAPIIPDLIPGVARITEVFLRKLTVRVLTRLADALDSNSGSEYDSTMKALE